VYNNKSLIVGLGIGLIVGATLLYMMNTVVQAGKKTPLMPSAQTVDTLTEKQIKDLAEPYFQLFPKNEKMYSKAEVDTLVKQKVTEELAKAPQAAPVQPKPEPAPAKKTYLYIYNGSNASQVSEMLYQAGLIVDRKQFEDELTKSQLAGKIRYGIHVFEDQPDLNAIITNLTSS
jgi:hypothetical protein